MASCGPRANAGNASKYLITLALMVTSGLLLASCTSEPEGSEYFLPAIGPADVDVDSPELREEKVALGIETCPSGGESGTSELPAISLPCLGGGPAVNLDQLEGPVVISVWAQWCTPCRNEMPILQEFYQEHGDSIPLLGIDYQDPQVDSAMKFMGQTGAKYPQIADVGGSINGQGPFVGLNKLPFLLVISSDGQVAGKHFVVIDSTDQLERIVEDDLDVNL